MASNRQRSGIVSQYQRRQSHVGVWRSAQSGIANKRQSIKRITSSAKAQWQHGENVSKYYEEISEC